MADERLLAGVRRFWTAQQVEDAYKCVLGAYSNGITKEVIITGTDFDGQNANGQIVLNREDMAAWLDVLESRTLEIGDAAEGLPEVAGTPSTDFRRRPMGT